MALHHSPKLVTNGLVLALDAGNTKSYPGSGTTWTDISGNGKNGTLTNGPTYSSTNGGSIVFDGTNDHVVETVALSDAFWQGSWSASFWVNADIVTGDRPLIGHAGAGQVRKELHLNIRNSKLYHGLWGDDLAGIATLSAGNWYHVVFTLNSSTYLNQIYLNGALDNSRTSGGPYAGTNTNNKIGNWGSDYFDGFMSSCTFYNRVLTAGEITQNFNALRGRFGI